MTVQVHGKRGNDMYEMKYLTEDDMPYFRRLAEEGRAVIIELSDQALFDLDIDSFRLPSGEIDRKKLEEEKARFHKEKDSYQASYQPDVSGAVFFRGVTNLFTLKKRYKDLIKLYHPDNLAGDKDTACMIREEYEMLKEKFERSFTGFGT